MSTDVQPAHLASYPFVNAQTMEKHNGKEVTLIGKVVSDVNNMDIMEVSAADKQPVTVYLDGPTTAQEGEFLMIRGVADVSGSLSIKANNSGVTRLPVGDKPFDLDTYNQFVLLAENNFSALFWD